MNDLEIMAARDADTEGPECGTELAVTYLRVTYSSGGELYKDTTRHCCYRHIPCPEAVLPEGAEIEEVVIEDGLYRTTTNMSGVFSGPVVDITAIDNSMPLLAEADLLLLTAAGLA